MQSSSAQRLFLMLMTSAGTLTVGFHHLFQVDFGNNWRQDAIMFRVVLDQYVIDPANGDPPELYRRTRDESIH